MRRQLLSVGSLVLVIVSGAIPRKASASLGPLGPALVLPIDNQTPVTPVIVEGRTGDFEIVWPGPTAPELAGQHLAADGTPTDEAVTLTEGLPEGTVAACLTGGEFVVAWVHVIYPAWSLPKTPSSSVVGARLLDSSGRPLGPELQLSAQSAIADHVKIAALSTGGFVALWSSRDSSGTTLLLRRFDSLGQQVGNDTVIPATGVTPIGVAGLADGGYLATWAAPGRVLRSARFDAGGQPIGTPAWQVDGVGGPALMAANAAGQVVFAWMPEDPSIQPATPIRARTFDLSAQPLSPELTVAASDSTGNPVLRGLAMGVDGTFTALWDRTPFQGLSAVFAQLYDSSGTPLGGQAQIDALSTGHDNHGHAVLASTNRTWLIQWSGSLQTSGDFVQRERSSFCSASTSSVCLRDDRFKIDVTFKDPRTSQVTVAHPVPVTPDSGGFWFFDSTYPELLVKVLDGAAVNDHFWLFYASLTDVEFDLTATDTTTGAQRVYHNPAGHMASEGDVDAFVAAASKERALPLDPHVWESDVSGETCYTTDSELCLSHSRFTVDVTWHDPSSGRSGSGHSVQRSNQSGDFWFFDPANIEMTVKILDGTPINGHFWVFYGSLTDVEFDLTITDVSSPGRPKRTYHNPPHHMASAADVDAF